MCLGLPLLRSLPAFAFAVLLGFPGAAQHAGSHHPQSNPSKARSIASDNAALALERVAAIHGQHGPFAVAGYRMGEAALKRLGLPRGSFDLEVVHHSPAKVQWSCIADGLQAATGVSAGKLNLHLVETSGEVYSLVRNRRTGQTVRLELSPAFAPRFENLPYDRLAEEGRAVMQLPDEKVFALGESPTGVPRKEPGERHAH